MVGKGSHKKYPFGRVYLGNIGMQSLLHTKVIEFSRYFFQRGNLTLQNAFLLQIEDLQ